MDHLQQCVVNRLTPQPRKELQVKRTEIWKYEVRKEAAASGIKGLAG
jgi:hypothetical protein